MKKKWRGNRKKKFFSEMLEMLLEDGLVKVMWDFPCGTIVWKLSLSKGESLLREEVDWHKFAYWLQRCQWLLLPLLSSWSHLYELC